MHGIVHQRARLDKHGKRIGRQVIAHRCRFLHEVRRHQVGHFLRIIFQAFQQLTLRRIRLGVLCNGTRGTAHRFVGYRELAHREDVHFVQRGNGLPGRGKEAADLVELVAEEIEAHRVCQVARVHIDGTSLHAERARAIELPGVFVAHGNQAMFKAFETIDTWLRVVCQISARNQPKRACHLLFRRCYTAQKRTRRSHHNDRLSLLQRPQRFQPAAMEARLQRRIK